MAQFILPRGMDRLHGPRVHFVSSKNHFMNGFAQEGSFMSKKNSHAIK